jgi:competence protein ComEA
MADGDAKRPEPVGPPKPRLWITRPDAAATVALAAVLMVVVGVIVARNLRLGGDVAVVKGPEMKYVIDVNSAPEAELALLPGIGPTRAKKIAEWRAQNGPLKGLDDVKKAARMPAKDMEKLKNKVMFGGGAEARNVE